MHDVIAREEVKTSSIGASVKISGLTKSYGDFIAVRQLDLDVRPGEFLSLLGPSGSGKTTTLSAIAGFVRPTAGEISIGGVVVTRVPPEKRNIGVVFQNYALFPHMTVEDNVAYPLRMRQLSSAAITPLVRQVLAAVQLDSFSTRYPAQLSGGQQQRVALARALVFGPSLMLFDEPLGALDKTLREHMQIELRRLHRECRATMIYVTHDQEEALLLSDRIAVINDGVLEQVDTPVRLYNNPATRFVAQFIGESNFIPGIIVQTDGNEAVIEAASMRLRGALAAPAKVGGKAELMVRPENVKSDAQCDNLARGVVVERLFIGNRVKLVVELPGGIAMQALFVGEELMKTSCGLGESVELSWRAADSRIFPNT